jgi:DNA-binding response OmpR family regulator
MILIIAERDDAYDEIFEKLKSVRFSGCITWHKSAVAALRAIVDTGEPVLIIMQSYATVDMDGFDFLKILREKSYATPVCLVVVDLTEERQQLVAEYQSATITDWQNLRAHLLQVLLASSAECR